ncbi:hypothetical protein GCM10023074_10350 [Microbispora amethystogenes]|uniref:Uncharacterized protein n=1 Tax=Microbispora amethystogenes TaxID=1427754 RepID=A0ABQ4FIK4_9ACTN|nr:hypothetical protein Mam01_47990 [Microbispora amethystogenes]
MREVTGRRALRGEGLATVTGAGTRETPPGDAVERHCREAPPSRDEVPALSSPVRGVSLRVSATTLRDIP